MQHRYAVTGKRLFLNISADNIMLAFTSIFFLILLGVNDIMDVD